MSNFLTYYRGERFVEKTLTLLNTNFETDHVKSKIDELAANIRPEIEKSINRWANIESVEKLEDDIQVFH